MKTLILSIVAVSIISFSALGQESKVIKKEVEASCGQCQFGLKGGGCDLAVRIDGKAYYIDGTDINDHGDAHGSDGFCNAIRKAKVEGEIVDGKFKATKFELLAAVKQDEKK